MSSDPDEASTASKLTPPPVRSVGDGPSIGLSGLVRLLLALLILIANVGLYTILPIASLGLLPMLLASICLFSGILDDLGFYE